MKNFFFSAFLILFITNLASAQSTAMDWTKEDCNGISHNCFSELDSGKVLLCEYVMTCGTCISAANYLNEIIGDYVNTNPGRVRLYAIDWHTSFTCSSFQSWAQGLKCKTFLNGYDEVTYYGGMGMPTLVVLGGNDHHVYYKKLGYNNSADNADVRAAIDQALNTTGISEDNFPITSFDAYPNPSTSVTSIIYSLQIASPVSLELSNLLGEKIQTIVLGQQGAGENHYLLNTVLLNSGLYFVQINTGTTKETIKLMVMN